MQYVAEISTPGYLPESTDPAIFDTAEAAWEYLSDERKRHEDESDRPDLPYSDTVAELDMMSSARVPTIGAVYGSTPQYEGDHDLGLVYSVSPVADEYADEGGPEIYYW